MNENDEKDLIKRLVHLEELVTHQSILIEELSQQLHRDGRAREKFERGLKMLVERVQLVEDMSSTAPEGEKPPHY